MNYMYRRIYEGKRRKGSAARREDGPLGLLKRSGGADRGAEEQVI